LLLAEKRKWYAVLALVSWFVIGVGWLAFSYFIADVPDANRIGTAVYGHNSAGIFDSVLLLFIGEFLVLSALLWPSRRPISLWRLSAAFCLLATWAILLGLASMHQGPVFIFHFWLVAGLALVLLGIIILKL
jgi:hypothetical protein